MLQKKTNHQTLYRSLMGITGLLIFVILLILYYGIMFFGGGK